MLQRIRLGFYWEAIILLLVLLTRPALAVVPTDAEDQTKAPAASPIAGGQRVFSAGHSFHVFVPGILSDMAVSPSASKVPASKARS